MSDIQDLEARKVKLGTRVTLRDQIVKLGNNPEFRAVFQEEFFKAEAGRLVRIGGDPNLDQAQRNDAIQMALATGHVQRFLSANIQMGNAAEDEIKQIDEALEEIRMNGEDE